MRPVGEVGELLTGAVVAALGAAGGEGRGVESRTRSVRPVNEENTNVGFLSFDASAGPLTSAVSMMRNGMLAVNAPGLPERSLPRTLKVC